MAGIIQRKNKWVAVYRDAMGKEIRKSTGVSVTPKVLPPGQSARAARANAEAQARIIAEEMEAVAKGNKTAVQMLKIAQELNDSILVSKKVPGAKAYLDDFLEAREGVRGAYERDGKAIRQFLGFLGERENVSLMLVTPATARDFMEKELERVSSGTVTRYMATLTCAFNRAVADKLLQVNPFRGVVPPKAARYDKQERGAFSVEEVKRLIRVLPGEWPDIVKVCLYTGGQRLGDVVSLRWEQIDLNVEIISMTTEKTKRRMTKPVIKALGDVLRAREAVRVNSFVFPVAASRYAQSGGKSSKLSLEFVSLLQEHGFIEGRAEKDPNSDRRVLAEKSFHSLRATAVTMLRLSGVSADLCRHIVGHDSEEIERGYIRPQSDQVATALDSLADEVEE